MKKEVFYCEDYILNLTDKDFKIFLDKKNMVNIEKAGNDKEGIILDLVKIKYDESNVRIGESKLNFKLVLGKLDKRAVQLLLVKKITHIGVFDGDNLMYVLEATIK